MPCGYWLPTADIEKSLQKDVARLDTAMTNRRGRSSLLEGIKTECYEGSEGENDEINAACLRWLALRGIALRCLSVAKDVHSSLAFAVARNSPQLKCLHMNYDDNNNTYMEQLDAFCPELDEVKLRDTKADARLVGSNVCFIQLVCRHWGKKTYTVFCERARLNANDWHRDSSVPVRRFRWRRFMYSIALIQIMSQKKGGGAWGTEIVKRIIKNAECNVAAVSRTGYTALKCAVDYGNTEIVRLLLQKDASNIDSQTIDDDKRTALMSACNVGNAVIIELLIRNGANLDIQDRHNKTAFDILDECRALSQAEKTRLKDIPRLIRQEQTQQASKMEEM